MASDSRRFAYRKPLKKAGDARYRFWWLDFGASIASRHLVGDLQAVAFQRDHLARMIGEHANPPQSQINQYLRADSAFALHQPLAP